MGSSYARTMLRIVSLRIDPIPVAFARDAVLRGEPFLERGKAIETLVAVHGPSRLPQDDEGRRVRAQIVYQLGAQPLDHRRVDVVIEVEVVHEPCRLDEPAAQERVSTALGRVEHLHEVTRPRARR